VSNDRSTLSRQGGHRSAQHPRKSDIPHPHVANVTDGTETVGFLVASDGSFFSFDRDAVLIGEFATQRQAMRAIPASVENADGRAVKLVKQ
jgi:hypothetical protein